MVFTQSRGFVLGASFGLQCRSLRCRVLVRNAADTASLAARFLFGKLNGVAAFFDFGEKRCRKNLPLGDPSFPMREADSTQPNVQPRRRWLSFSIRTLLVAMLIFASLFAWLGKHVIRTRAERPVVAQIQAAGGNAYYDYQLGFGFVNPAKTPVGSKLVRTMLGDDIYATVNVVSFYNPTTDADIKDLHKLANLLDVSISGPGITDECIDDLLRINKFRSLNLSDTSITPEGLARLSASKTLQHLTLYGNTVTDAHLQTLPSFPNLQFLQVIRAPVTDSGIKPLGSIKQLRQLDIFTANAVTDAGIQQLANLTNLEQLKLLQTAVTDDSLPTVSKMIALKTLQLDGHPLTHDGFRHLESLKQLEWLHLRDTKIDDNSLDVLSRFSNLKYLNIAGTLVSDDGLSHLIPLQSLERLEIQRTSVTDAGLQQLAKLETMVSLGVEIENHITMDGVDALKTKLPNCVIKCWDLEPDGSGVLAETR